MKINEMNASELVLLSQVEDLNVSEEKLKERAVKLKEEYQLKLKDKLWRYYLFLLPTPFILAIVAGLVITHASGTLGAIIGPILGISAFILALNVGGWGGKYLKAIDNSELLSRHFKI